MTANNISLSINPIDLLIESNYELDLVPYMLNLKLLESGIPVIIDPLSIRSNRMVLKHGELSVVDNGLTITYTWKNK
ncbi:hypothetical protein OPFAMLBM_00022 [Aeromonas phage avDM12-TAAL]|nr:hypothetical protein OPFAMLBM_00022 [Aeromonas phage avDM12-TAAL]